VAGVRQLALGAAGPAFVALRWLATAIGALAAAVLFFAVLSVVFGGAWT
jgi:hypothetical protein